MFAFGFETAAPNSRIRPHAHRPTFKVTDGTHKGQIPVGKRGSKAKRRSLTYFCNVYEDKMFLNAMGWELDESNSEHGLRMVTNMLRPGRR